MFKRFLVGFLSILVVVISSVLIYDKGNVFNVLSLSLKVSGSYSNSERVIIIDAGHGGFDGGAVAYDGTVEKDLNLAIALKLDALLRASGFKTVMVRSGDTATNDPTDGDKAKVSDIKNRVKLMTKYPNGIFVSVHMNKYSTTQPHGAQVFYSKVEGSKDLALFLQTSVAEFLQTDNKRVIKPAGKDIYLLQHASVPCVIVECGFLSNPKDLADLKSEDYQLKLAMALSYGIINYENNGNKTGES